jgi:hypothetical protein
MRPATTATTVLLLLAALMVSACGSPEQTGGTGAGGGDGGDGKLHPPGNGQHVSEATACDALSMAQDARNQALQCAATSRPCPTLLRVVFTTPCMEYDQGSVQGCLDYYDAQPTCDALSAAVVDCVITPFPGTEPNGCPDGG